jgi:lysophospholipase L1-like esterase
MRSSSWPRWWLVALVSSALVAAVVGPFVAVRAMYARELSMRLDPLGRAFYPESGPLPRDPGTRLVVLYGDSRAAQWPTPSLPGFRFANRGIGGQTSAQILERAERDLFALRPDVVVLELCTNDLKAVSMLPEASEQVIAGCLTHTAELVRRARARGIAVVLCSVFALGDAPLWRRVFDLTDAMAAAIGRVNRALHAQLGRDVAWLDADPLLGTPEGRLRPGYTEDGVHLTPQAYAALEPALRTLLLSLPKAVDPH